MQNIKVEPFAAVKHPKNRGWARGCTDFVFILLRLKRFLNLYMKETLNEM